MKKDIHPNYVEATVHCSCGNTFTTRSTKKELHVELCSQCHPFYTGKQKLVDSGGRVDRFKRRLEKKAEPAAKAAPAKAEPKVEVAAAVAADAPEADVAQA
jgi:large subunit ribosomal protein L31